MSKSLLTKLSTRSLLAIQDSKPTQKLATHSRTFLQGLLTNNINNLTSQNALYSALLTPQGRVLSDLLLYSSINEEKEVIMLEHDSNWTNDLLNHLQRYKLRCPITFDHLSTHHIYHSFSKLDSKDFDDALIIRDPRTLDFGFRIISKTLQNPSLSEEKEYLHKRIHFGIAEGIKDLPSSLLLPQDSNFDLFHGIDYKKGCYVGQELTIRTHHTGMVRKRLFPFQLLQHSDYKVNDKLYLDKESRSKREAGRLISFYEEIGMGFLQFRFESLTVLSKQLETEEIILTSDNGFKVKLLRPRWLSEQTHTLK